MKLTEAWAIGRDGTRLHWSSSGTGAPAVVLLDGVGCAGYIWRFLRPDLAPRHRVIHWNYRGHGKSERPVDPARVSVADCVDDLWAVLDAAGERSAVLIGHSMGVQVALEAHRNAPERVAGLVLVCGAPGRALDAIHDLPLAASALPYAKLAVDRFPGLSRLVFRSMIPTQWSLKLALTFEVNETMVAREDMIRYLDDLADIDPALFVKLLGSAAQGDSTDHLPSIAAPTLILAGERDSFTPMWLSVKMHAAIPGSELLVLPGGSHVGPLEHPELCALRVEKFFNDHFGASRPAVAAPGRPA